MRAGPGHHAWLLHDLAAGLAGWHAHHGGRWEFAHTAAKDQAGEISDALLADLEEVPTAGMPCPSSKR
jgi:hypothetical protein